MQLVAQKCVWVCVCSLTVVSAHTELLWPSLSFSFLFLCFYAVMIMNTVDVSSPGIKTRNVKRNNIHKIRCGSKMVLCVHRMQTQSVKKTYYLQLCGKSKPSIDRHKIYRHTRAGSSFSQLKAQSHLSCWISAPCFLQTACSLTLCFYLGKECPGVRKWHTHEPRYTVNLSLTSSLTLTGTR